MLPVRGWKRLSHGNLDVKRTGGSNPLSMKMLPCLNGVPLLLYQRLNQCRRVVAP